jgi:hypothetical protein
MRRKKDVPVSGMKIESGREGYWQTSVRVKEREDILKRDCERPGDEQS